jgi:hypothetical protein
VQDTGWAGDTTKGQERLLACAGVRIPLDISAQMVLGKEVSIVVGNSQH